jgi:hypothetical protein
VQVCNDEAAHDQINQNAQELGGANGALRNQDSARTVPSRLATRHIAAHDEMSERSALRSYLAILGVSAAVVGIATGFAAGIGKEQTCRSP